MKEKKRRSNEERSPSNSNENKQYTSETSESDVPKPLLKEQSIRSKLSSFKVRIISSLIMVASFILFLSAGHFYCCLLVLLINIFIFKEIISLKRNQLREAKLPYFYIIN